ncbi:MAG: hypothetical protein AAF747_00085, partial [Planctomycetota bacterium]
EGDEGANDTPAWLGLGNLAVALKDQNRLRMAAQRVQALAPRQPDGYLFQAIFLQRRDQPGPSMAQLDRAAQLGASPAVVGGLRAMALDALGRTDEAADVMAAARSAAQRTAGVITE